MAHFLDRVHTRRLKQLGKLRADPIYAEQIGMIDPLEDKLGRNAGFLGNLLTSRRFATTLEQLVDRRYALGFKFLGVGLANAFDFIDSVFHSP